MTASGGAALGPSCRSPRLPQWGVAQPAERLAVNPASKPPRCWEVSVTARGSPVALAGHGPPKRGPTGAKPTRLRPTRPSPSRATCTARGCVKLKGSRKWGPMMADYGMPTEGGGQLCASTCPLRKWPRLVALGLGSCGAGHLHLVRRRDYLEGRVGRRATARRPMNINPKTNPRGLGAPAATLLLWFACAANRRRWGVAQPAERLAVNQEVGGSNPPAPVVIR